MRKLRVSAFGPAVDCGAVSLDLARTLVLTEVVPWGPVAQALYASVTRGVPFVRALLDTEALSLEKLEEELARADAPMVTMLSPDMTLVEKLPRGMCGRFCAVPTGKDPNGTVELALADARDAHARREFEHHLGVTVRVVRAPFAKMEEVVSRLPSATRQESVVESTLVSVRAPVGIVIDPPSERTKPELPSPPVMVAAAPPRPSSNAAIPRPSQTTSQPVLPLVRKAAEQPIPLVRRAEEQPVLELRAPYSQHAMPSARPAVELAAATAMRSAQSRDEILKLLLEGASEVAKRVILLAVKKEGYTGLLCSPAMGDEARIRELRVPPEGPSIFVNVATGGTYLGPVYALQAHKPVLALLPGISDMVAVTAVRLKGRPLVLLLAEGMNAPVKDVTTLEELARAAGEAFARILAARGE